VRHQLNFEFGLEPIQGLRDMFMAAWDPYLRSGGALVALTPGFCVQQLLTNGSLSRSQRANVASYGFVVAFLLRIWRTVKPNLYAQRRGGKSVRFFMTDEMLEKLLLDLYCYSQLCFPQWPVRLSSIGTMIQEHVHAHVRRIMHGDCRAEVLDDAVKRLFVKCCAMADAGIAPQQAPSRNRLDQDVYIEAGDPTEEEGSALIPLGQICCGVIDMFRFLDFNIPDEVERAWAAHGVPVPPSCGIPELPKPLFLGDLMDTSYGPCQKWVTTRSVLLDVTSGLTMAQNKSWLKTSVLKGDARPRRQTKVREEPQEEHTVSPAAEANWQERVAVLLSEE
jgi:hypothetical protein